MAAEVIKINFGRRSKKQFINQSAVLGLRHLAKPQNVGGKCKRRHKNKYYGT